MPISGGIFFHEDFKTKKSLDHKNAQKFGSKISRNLHKVPESQSEKIYR
ncbi:hypothetical protein KADA111694_02350 [Kaistella daneshvariae]